MKKYNPTRNHIIEPTQVDQEITWTETLMVVEEETLFPEILGEGKSSFSIRMELVEDTQSSSNTRKRTEIQLAFGLEEKDVPTFARLLGRKILLIQQRPVETLEREQLVIQLKEANDLIGSLEGKVKYLNDSLHHYVQESR